MSTISIASLPDDYVKLISNHRPIFDPYLSFAIIDEESMATTIDNFVLLKSSKIKNDLNTKENIRIDIHQNACQIVAIHGNNEGILLKRLLERVSIWNDPNNGKFNYLWMSLDLEGTANFYSVLLD